MKSTFEKAKTVAIAALNESHRKHDPSLNKIMDCKFCSSAAAEGTIARHFEPIFKEVNTQQEQIERLTAALEHETSEKVRIISERTTLLAEVSNLTIAVREVFDGRDHNTGISGQVFVDHGSLMARMSLVNASASGSPTELVYGLCPICGSKGVSRERRPNGNDKCEAGHTYPSKDAITADSRHTHPLRTELTDKCPHCGWIICTCDDSSQDLGEKMADEYLEAETDHMADRATVDSGPKRCYELDDRSYRDHWMDCEICQKRDPMAPADNWPETDESGHATEDES